MAWSAKRGEREKKYKCCYRAFNIFQSIWFLSLFAYVYLVLRPWPIESTIEAIQTKPITAILLSLVGPLHLLVVGLAFGLYWNSLLRCEILEVSSFRKKNYPELHDIQWFILISQIELNQKPWKSAELWSFAIFGIASISYFSTCLSWIALRNLNENLQSFPEVPELVLETLLPAIYIWFLIGM